MVTYTVKLREYSEDIEVPVEIKGLSNVAHYITDQMATAYSLGKSGDPLKFYDSWYDSHYHHILHFLEDLREKLRIKKRMEKMTMEERIKERERLFK